jgi:hypothetical protein
MGNVLRFENRGRCPREFLLRIGATSKKASDAKTIGYYASGAKFAAIAALRLDIILRWASSDDEGQYFLGHYAGNEVEIAGVTGRAVLAKFHNGPTHDLWTNTAAGRNWTEPIGDDDMKSFKVLREIVTNARDPDPSFGRHCISEVDKYHYAPPDVTVTYLTKTPEIEHMLAHADRYFKYLADGLKPIAIIPGLGEIYPKSEAGATRMFLQGTLAHCQKNRIDTTLFDYSFDDKLLVSEERTFKNLNDVYRRLSTMMMSLPDEGIIRQALDAMIDGKAGYELASLTYIADGVDIPAAEIWRRAWHAKYDDAVGKRQAVLATTAYADEVARYSHRKVPVHVTAPDLRRFLRLCGVASSSDFVAKNEQDGYRIIRAQGAELDVLKKATAILLAEFPAAKDVPIAVFEALDDRFTKTLGFCLPAEKPWTQACIQRTRLGSVWDAYRTLYHELRHIRTQATDGTRDFDRQADEDILALTMAKHGIADDRAPPEPEEDPLQAALDNLRIEE